MVYLICVSKKEHRCSTHQWIIKIFIIQSFVVICMKCFPRWIAHPRSMTKAWLSVTSQMGASNLGIRNKPSRRLNVHNSRQSGVRGAAILSLSSRVWEMLLGWETCGGFLTFASRMGAVSLHNWNAISDYKCPYKCLRDWAVRLITIAGATSYDVDKSLQFICTYDTRRWNLRCLIFKWVVVTWHKGRTPR